MEATIHPQILPSAFTSRIVCWVGAVLHETHDSVLEQLTPEFLDVSKREGISDPKTSVYISSVISGSPALTRLQATHWILEVDENKVGTMDDMLKIISILKDRGEKEYVRVKTIENRGVTSLVSIRLDSKFWPAWILEWEGKQWVRTELE